jgi:hypothetical protein
MQERISEFLAQNIKPEQVASIVGCSAGYISQLLKDPIFKEKVLAKAAEYQSSNAPKDIEDKVIANKYLAVEHKALQRIESAMDHAELPALVLALREIGNRQDKRAQRHLPQLSQAPGVTHNTIIALNLPAHMAVNVPTYQLNEVKEVIAIGGESMATLSSEGVKNLFAQISGKTQLPIDNVVADF